MKVRRRYHLHAPGFVALGVTIMLGLGAVNSQNNLLFIAFGLALGLILLSGLISGTTIMRCDATRAPISAARVGEPLPIVYRVRNRSRWLPAFGLVIEETHRRKDVVSRASLPRVRAAALHIPAGQSRFARATVTPAVRGCVHLTGVRIWTTFPLGALKKSATRQQPSTVLVWPRLAPIAPAILDQALSGSGVTDNVSRRIGRDAEFYGLREYAPGDPVRRIAWRASARTGDLLVRESYAAMSADVTIVISFAAVDDAGADPAPDDADEAAISAAASLAEAASRRGARVRLLVPAADLCAEALIEGHEASACRPIHDALARLDLHAIERLRALRTALGARGAIIVIHARQVDPSVAPGAAHVSAARSIIIEHAPPANPDPAEVAA